MELILDLNKRYTLADYLTWADDVRRELIDGVVSLMAAPHRDHARVNRNMFRQLDAIVENKNCGCEVYYAPVDVCLSENGERENDKIYTVVQPDIFIVCDDNKFINGKCYGAPDMIVEILSPSNRKKDLQWKYSIYEKAGVREYWIANPKTKSVTAYVLQDNGEYDDGTDYISGEKIPLHLFAENMIEMDKIFNIQ
jgi:Uma2 family endonuclease